jgi:hypothetical protein
VPPAPWSVDRPIAIGDQRRHPHHTDRQECRSQPIVNDGDADQVERMGIGHRRVRRDENGDADHHPRGARLGYPVVEMANEASE